MCASINVIGKAKKNLYISKLGLRHSSITGSFWYFLITVEEFCFRNSTET